MTEIEALRQRETITAAQRAYMDENWDDYDALVQFVAWAHEIDMKDAYVLVEHGPIIF
jgi:hypothetical protein